MLKSLFFTVSLGVFLEIEHSRTISVIGVLVLEFLLNLNSLQSDFFSPFFLPGCLRKKKTLLAD